MSVPDAAWKQLLSASVELSGQTPEPASEPPSQQDLEFLQNAMAESFGAAASAAPNQPNLYQKFVEFGAKATLTSAEIADALEVSERLDDWLAAGMYSSSFETDEALNSLLHLTVESENDEVCLAYVSLIPLLAENRPQFQENICKHKIFSEFLTSLDKKLDAKPRILAAVLSAISAIVRSSPEAFKVFVTLKGLQRFENVVAKYQNDRVAAKAAIILSNIHFSMNDETPNTQTPAFKKLVNTICHVYIELKKRHNHIESTGVNDEAEYAFVQEAVQKIVTTITTNIKSTNVDKATKSQLLEFIGQADAESTDHRQIRAVFTDKPSIPIKGNKSHNK
uniref:Hsp70 nucleotide exchange factor fes1 n=1 Tax=Caenorhabditis japonica TaxID=281687 RepID=A0A8R1EJL5_CAEJA